LRDSRVEIGAETRIVNPRGVAKNGNRCVGVDEALPPRQGKLRPGRVVADHGERLGRAAALAEDATAFALGGPAPDAIAFAMGKGEFEAGLPHGTSVANGFGDVRLVVGHRIEDVRVDAPTGGKLPPVLVGQGDHILTASLGN
jgi:hypothetical protein